jgi:hypothetical protein
MLTYTTGKWEKIDGVESYVATPAGDYAKDKVVLFLSDIYGPQLPNAQVSLCEIRFIRGLLAVQLLADDFANNGFKVRLLMPITNISWRTDCALPILDRCSRLF